MKFETKLSKEQFLDAIKASVRTQAHVDAEVFKYHYRLTAAYHLADVARNAWDNDAYVSIFMGEPFTKFETEADVDTYFGNQYDILLEEFENYEDVEEHELHEDVVYTPEQFIKKLELA